MYRELDDFFQLHSFLTDGTKKVFGKLEDKNLNQSVAEGYRTLGQIAWHIVTTIPEMMSKTGLDVGSIDPGSMPPSSAFRRVARESIPACCFGGRSRRSRCH